MNIIKRLLYSIAVVIVCVMYVFEICIRIILLPIVWVISGYIIFNVFESKIWANNLFKYSKILLPKEDKQ